MKIYKKEPDSLVRISIFKQGEAREYLTLCETTIDDVFSFCKEIIESQNLSVFNKGKKTAITIREAVGAKNGKSVNLSFTGLTPKETLGLIIYNVNGTTQYPPSTT